MQQQFDTSGPQFATAHTDTVEKFKTIEYRCQAMRKTLGFVDHYFLVVDDKEYHAGFYKRGKVLPADTTKGYHSVMFVDVCESCYVKIVADYRLEEDIRIFNYFPLLNCETLCRGFSVQSMALLSLPFVGMLLWKKQFAYAIILLLVVAVAVLSYSKYVFSRCKKTVCTHLKNRIDPQVLHTK